jgi:hypothetical protein
MKKALQITFGAVMALSIVGQVEAHDATLGRTALLITGTYSKTTNDGLSYGDILLAPPVIAGSDSFRRHVFIDPDWEFDYGVGITHRFCGSNTRLFAYYDHFRGDDEAGTSGVRNLGIPANPGVNGAVTNGSMNVETKSDEFRLGLSRGLNFGHHFSLDLGGFFEWDKIERNSEEFQSQPGAINRFRSTENEIKGFGPGVAVMARAFPSHDYCHFSVFMGASTTLLYATNEFDQSLFEGTDLFYQYQPDDSKSVLGKFDISFGVDYCNRIRTDCNGMTVGMTLGVRYLNIVNAFKNGNTAYNNAIQQNDGTNFQGFAANTGSTNDFGRIGPFLQFRIGGAGA